MPKQYTVVFVLLLNFVEQLTILQDGESCSRTIVLIYAPTVIDQIIDPHLLSCFLCPVYFF